LTRVSRFARSRRRVAFLALLVAAWVLGSALGAVAPAGRASASSLFELQPVRAGYVPTLTGTKPILMLVIGSGARPGDDVMHSLSDSIHILAIDPAKDRATIVGIPRDSWVSIPGHGSNKINASMVDGGPPLLVQTVEQLTGLKLDYWALTTFWGFTSMINQIGGLRVDVPFAMHDNYSHSDFEPGLQTLNGGQALAMARDRHSLPSGDFGRSENAGVLMLSALAQFRKEFEADPSRLFTWIGAGMRNLETSVPFDQIVNLAFTASAINPKHVTNTVFPGGTGMEGSLSVVHLDTTKVAAMSKDLAHDGLLTKRNVPPNPNAALLGG
jgi:LCP family protein required for cell wall assembly